MESFQDFFVTAMIALIFSCIIVKLVLVAVPNDVKIDDSGKAAVQEANLSKGLVVKSRRSKKRVKFVDQAVVRNVDHFDTQKPNIDLVESVPCVVGVVDESCEKEGCEDSEERKVCSEDVLVEEKIKTLVKKGDDFKGEKVPENLEVIEKCGGEREVSDGCEYDDVGLLKGKVEVKKIDDLCDVKEEVIVKGLVVDSENVVEPNLVGDVVAIDQSVVGDGVKVCENEVVEVGVGLSEGDEKAEKMAKDEDFDDDWEGIERSELEEEFAKAVKFVDEKGKDGGLENLGSELMMQLYGLQKIAMEGPCHEPQPMALKVSARAKWNAWQRMGSMSPELAMEQYIELLADNVPGRMHHTKDGSALGTSEIKMPGDPDSRTDLHEGERKQEMNHAAKEGDFAGGEKVK